jgi:hypothetical protein
MKTEAIGSLPLKAQEPSSSKIPLFETLLASRVYVSPGTECSGIGAVSGLGDKLAAVAATKNQKVRQAIAKNGTRRNLRGSNYDEAWRHPGCRFYPVDGERRGRFAGTQVSRPDEIRAYCAGTRPQARHETSPAGLENMPSQADQVNPHGKLVGPTLPSHQGLAFKTAEPSSTTKTDADAKVRRNTSITTEIRCYSGPFARKRHRAASTFRQSHGANGFGSAHSPRCACRPSRSRSAILPHAGVTLIQGSGPERDNAPNREFLLADESGLTRLVNTRH